MTVKFKVLFLFGLFTCIYGKGQNIKRVFVEGGTTIYNEKIVDVSAFYITKYEITNNEYAYFLNENSVLSDGVFNGNQIINSTSEDLQLIFKNNQWQPKTGKDNFPMVMVNYYGAVAFCEWAKGKLPTEIQWYYAACGGKKSKNYTYSGSNILEEVGWYSKNSKGQSHKVGMKRPNSLGIYDMSGNAWEWCLNNTLKSDTDFCLHMGGSWFAEKQPSSVLAHYGNTPSHFSNSVGFRIIFPINNTNSSI